jgi:hypothetical protein
MPTQRRSPRRDWGACGLYSPMRHGVVKKRAFEKVPCRLNPLGGAAQKRAAALRSVAQRWVFRCPTKQYIPLAAVLQASPAPTTAASSDTPVVGHHSGGRGSGAAHATDVHPLASAADATAAAAAVPPLPLQPPPPTLAADAWAPGSTGLTALRSCRQTVHGPADVSRPLLRLDDEHELTVGLTVRRLPVGSVTVESLCFDRCL